MVWRSLLIALVCLLWTTAAPPNLTPPPSAQAASKTVRSHIHHHSIGGTVMAIARGILRLSNSYTHQRFVVQVTAQTRYTLAGKPVAAARLQVGMHVRVHGYDALRQTQRGVLTLIADRVTLLLHERLIGGTVVSIDGGVYQLLNPYYGSKYTVHVTARTQYIVAGKPSRTARVQVGMHLRAHGFDAVHNDRRGILTIIADRIYVLQTGRHPTHQAITGIVAGLAPGIIHLSGLYGGPQIAFRVNAQTKYTIGKKPLPAATLQIGMEVRAEVTTSVSTSSSAGSTAYLVHLLVHERTLSGTLAKVGQGMLTLKGLSGSQFSVHLLADVLYLRDGKPARTIALLTGLHIRVHGYDTGLVSQAGTSPIFADSVEVLRHHHTISGVVDRVGGDGLRLVEADGSHLEVQFTTHTVYIRSAKPITVRALRIGMQVRAQGYDGPQITPSQPPPLIAEQIDVIVPRSQHKAVSKARLPTPSPSPALTPITLPGATAPPTAVPTVTASRTATPSPVRPSATPSATASSTVTVTLSPTGTNTATQTATPSITATAVPSVTATSSPTATPSFAPSATPTPSSTATASATVSPTPSPR